MKNPYILTITLGGSKPALNYLLNAINTGTVPSSPSDLDAALNRTIATRARLRRSHSLARTKWSPSESVLSGAAAEANVELDRIGSVVKEADGKILLDAGLGYTDREIASRHASTPGAIRVRLSRLRFELAATGHSATCLGSGRKSASPMHRVLSPRLQSARQAA